MPAVTVRKISVRTHQALKRRAARHGNSTEAEIRLILEEAVKPKAEVGLGTKLQEFGRKYGALPEFKRDPTPLEPASFE
jgi:plasmid stability protein